MSPDATPIRRAAVLCPGPSLNLHHFAKHAADTLIGVNRAVEVFPCDYWVCLDSETYGFSEPIGLPVIVCRKAIREQIEMKHGGMQMIPLTFLNPDDIDLASEPANWPKYGSTVAIALAASLGAERIDCYGMDLEGREDHDGFTDKRQRRSPGRWRVEKRLLAKFLPWLESRGVEVSGVPVLEGVA